MKGIRYLFAGLMLGTVMGWAMGFLRLPYLEKDFSFLLGFVAALAFVSLVLILLRAWNGDFLSALSGKKTASGDAQNTRRHAFIWIILLGVLVLGGVFWGVTVYRHQLSLQLEIQNQDRKMRDMAALVEAVKKDDPEPLLRSMLDEVGEELKRRPGRTLSDSTLTRIAALSFSFKPYKYVEGDSLSDKACSPGRGQLLQALVQMNMDTGTFGRIKRNTLFAGADLRGTILKGLDLSGIDLSGANLKDADLSDANLKGARLGGANFWGANLNWADLSNTDLKRADLRWAQLNEATLIKASLSGAQLSNAQLTKANLTDAMFQWGQSDGALFNEANLTNVYFVGTDLSKANLNRADLYETDLRRTNFSQADLVGVELDKALVEQNWLEKLKAWQPTGLKELQENYTVVNDTADSWKRPLYRVKKM